MVPWTLPSKTQILQHSALVAGMAFRAENVMWEPPTETTASSICPGRYLSDNSLYAIVSSVLAAFDINPPLDADGKPSQLKAEVTGGLISYDTQPCSILILANTEILLGIPCHSIALSHREPGMSRALFAIVCRWIDHHVRLFCSVDRPVLNPSNPSGGYPVSFLHLVITITAPVL